MPLRGESCHGAVAAHTSRANPAFLTEVQNCYRDPERGTCDLGLVVSSLPSGKEIV